MASAGRISVDFVARTGEFGPAVDGMRGKVKALNDELGNTGHGVTGMQAASASLRTLEGRLDNNIRAAERFISSFAPIRNVLVAAFPVVGALATVGAFYDLFERASKIKEKLDEIRESASRVRQGFEDIVQPLRVTNLELETADDKIKAQIAKLGGKPVNNLVAAMHETGLEAERTAEKIRQVVLQTQKLLEKESFGALIGFITNRQPTEDLKTQNKTLLSDLTDLSLAQEAALVGRNPAQAKASYEAFSQARIDRIHRETDALKEQIRVTEHPRSTAGDVVGIDEYGREIKSTGDIKPAPNETRLSDLKGMLVDAQQLLRYGAAAKQLAGDTNTLHGMQAAKTPEKKDYYGDLLAQLQNELEGSAEKAKYAGDIIGTAIASGSEKAAAAIERLAEEGVKLTAADRLGITMDETKIALNNELARTTVENQRKIIEANKQRLAQDVALTREGIRLEAEREKRADDELGKIGKLRSAAGAAGNILSYQGGAAFGTFADRQRADLYTFRANLDEQYPDTDSRYGDLRSKLTSNFATQQQLDAKNSGEGMSIHDGYKKFTSQLVDNFKSAGYQIQQLLGGVFSTLSDQFTSFLSGAKISWSGFFQSLASSFAKFGLNTLFGMLGSWLGKGGLGSAGGFFSGLFKADGGSVMGGSPYVVGERGPELFVPGSGGSIMPNGMAMGGGGVYYNIDARGTDPQTTERNVRRALQLTHTSAVQNGVMATQEMTRRRPR